MLLLLKWSCGAYMKEEYREKTKRSKKGRVIAIAAVAAAAVIAGVIIHSRFGGSENVDVSGSIKDLEVEEYILTESPNYNRSGKLAISGLMLHSVGMAVSDGKYLADVFGEPDYTRAGVHGFIDSKTGVVYHTLPWNQVAWHCGGDGILTHIGVEMCETDAGHYEGNDLIIEDKAQAKKDCKTSYDTAVKLFAVLCDRYGLDPLKDGVIISHREGAERGIASNHGDPESYWAAVGSGYTMDGFREDVSDMMKSI